MSVQPPSHGVGEGRPRIALPKSIAQTLTYLDDSDLEALRWAVEQEVRRRRVEKGEEAADTPPEVRRAKGRSTGAAAKQDGSALPVGKASLIRASAQSGMKPQAIARSLRLPVAEVNRVLKGEGNSRR
jgi:hypothetical protein